MTFEIATHILQSFVLRNRIILADSTNRTTPHQVNIHWWELPGDNQNIGDALSPFVVKYMMERNGIQSYHSANGKTNHLYAIGSIIDGAYQNATIWGSGILNGSRSHWWRKLRKLDVRCVRGPETRKVLLDNGYKCPERYGDPAILLPLVYNPMLNDSHTKTHDYKVVQHHVYNSPVPNPLSPMTSDYRAFIDELAKSKRIISSSLHGIILAEAYGIPAVLLKHDLNMFKYEDYYHSTERYDFPIANSIDEALDIEPAPLPDLVPLQNALLESFPIDLFAEHW